MSHDEFDVAIVGARVAGSLLAARLGREGLRVLLVDANRFPSETHSTHFFRGGGLLAALGTAGILQDVLALDSPKLIREYNFLNGAETPELGPAQDPGEIGFNLSVRRLTLDALLVRHACAVPGVEFSAQTRAVGLRTENGRVTGVDLEANGAPRRVRAKLVVGADGRRSWLAREVDAPILRSEPGHRGMYYAYYTGYEGVAGPRDGPEFSLNGDEIAYVFPSDAGYTCIALSLNLDAYRWCQTDPVHRFEERMGRHPGIAKRMARARRAGGVRGVGPTPNFVRFPAGPGWALVGDAEMHRDPWTGQGMDAAGTHAVLLTDAILGWHRGASSEEEAGREYARRRDEYSLANYESTVQGSRNLGALSGPDDRIPAEVPSSAGPNT